MVNITEHLANAYARIGAACKKAQRDESTVRLIAVSKTKPVASILAAYAAGQRDFAENYAQEFAQKVEALHAYPDLCWHMIGPLQTNKAKLVANAAHWVHSIDRLKIAQKLSQLRSSELAPLNVLIQVNISGEPTKSGVLLQDVTQLADAIIALPHVQLRGLMAIGGLTDNPKQTEQEFAALATAFNALKQHYPAADTLSLGMSDDLELAINYGSTMVRIGSAIFGARDYTNPTE